MDLLVRNPLVVPLMTAPTTIPVVLYLVAVADEGNLIWESDKTDNTAAYALRNPSTPVK